MVSPATCEPSKTVCGTLAHPDRELRRRKINFDLSDIHAQREDPTPQTISSSLLMLDVQWLAHKAAKSAGMSIYQARCPTCGKLRELVPFDSKQNVCLRLFIAQRYDRFVVCVCVSPSPFFFFFYLCWQLAPRMCLKECCIVFLHTVGEAVSTWKLSALRGTHILTHCLQLARSCALMLLLCFAHFKENFKEVKIKGAGSVQGVKCV